MVLTVCDVTIRTLISFSRQFVMSYPLFHYIFYYTCCNKLSCVYRCEKEYTISQRQLQVELTDKRTLVTNLKQQLDVHQSNVDDLKSELNRARKRQVSLQRLDIINTTLGYFNTVFIILCCFSSHSCNDGIT